MSYKSKALNREVCVNVIIPEAPSKSEDVGRIQGNCKTLYLLHGLSGNHNDWIRFTAIERYAKAHRIAVVMPAVERSWYADTAYDANYFTFVTDELPKVCRSFFVGMSDKREDNYVGGLSMGGYGAVKVAMKCPERYAGCISLSGSLDITRKGRPYNLNEWRASFGFGLESALELEGGENDLFALLKKNCENGVELPKLYFWCGTEDTLIKTNREYHELLTSLGVDHVYTESEGDHTWGWWDLHIQDALNYFFPIEK